MFFGAGKAWGATYAVDLTCTSFNGNGKADNSGHDPTAAGAWQCATSNGGNGPYNTLSSLSSNNDGDVFYIKSDGSAVTLTGPIATGNGKGQVIYFDAAGNGIQRGNTKTFLRPQYSDYSLSSWTWTVRTGTIYLSQVVTSGVGPGFWPIYDNVHYAFAVSDVGAFLLGTPKTWMHVAQSTYMDTADPDIGILDIDDLPPNTIAVYMDDSYNRRLAINTGTVPSGTIRFLSDDFVFGTVSDGSIYGLHIEYAYAINHITIASGVSTNATWEGLEIANSTAGSPLFHTTSHEGHKVHYRKNISHDNYVGVLATEEGTCGARTPFEINNNIVYNNDYNFWINIPTETTATHNLQIFNNTAYGARAKSLVVEEGCDTAFLPFDSNKPDGYWSEDAAMYEGNWYVALQDMVEEPPWPAPTNPAYWEQRTITQVIAPRLYNNVFNGECYVENNARISQVTDNNQCTSYTGKNSQAAHDIITDPLFVGPSEEDFSLQFTSPAINAGSNICSALSNATDFAGNSVCTSGNFSGYGSMDIGAYEYQPPYESGADEIDTGSGARIYGDGKFQNIDSTSGTTANLSIDPEGSDTTKYLDILPPTGESAIVWESNQKKWKESSDNLGTTNTLHTVGDLISGNTYTLTIDGNSPSGKIESTDCSQDGTCTATDNQISFTYTGGYSDHEFELTGVGTSGDEDEDLNTHKIQASSAENTITIEWKTDYKSKSTIRYGTDKNLKQKKEDNKKEKNHKIILKNLIPNTKYYFRIKSQDSDDNEDKSKIYSIETKSGNDKQSNNLQGNTGTRYIQESLSRLGFLDGQYITGFYGPITTEAVKNFQEQNGLPVTGYFGPLTKAKMEELLK